jgi:hypothetical protein
MANRFPLIVDPTSQRIKELPSGDNLDLTGSGIVAVRNVIPETSGVYDLGSAEKRWGELYLSGDSLYLGNSRISFNGTSFIFESGEDTATLPVAGDLTFATVSGTETLSNKTISGASNTLSNIANSSLTNSDVVIGDTSISLGATATTITGLSSVTSTSFVGALTGNASTATKLATSRTIALTGDVTGSASFDGSGNIEISTTSQANSVELGTDTTGNYVASMTAGVGITVGTATGEGSTPVITNTGVLSIVAGNAINVSGATGEVTINHADTSSVSNISSDNSGSTVIQDVSLTFDTYGHVTGASVGTVNLDDRYYTETESDSRFVNSTGDTMSGFLALHADPTTALHAATKRYVDEVAEGLKAKPAARAATTSNLSAIYDNGTNGVGATLTADTNRAFGALDGVTAWAITTPPMGILVKNQTNPAHNGRYNLTSLGETGVSPWVLTRCGLCDESDEIPGSYTFVTSGTLNGGTGWVQIVLDPSTFVVGTDSIIVTQFSGAGTYTAGAGLTLTGSEFSHADTSSVTNLSSDNSGNTFIQDISLTFDTYGHVTGATVATGTVSVGDGTLTVNTSGTGLSGSGTFTANQGGDNTITITSNATSSNTQSTIVARDSSGNFSAGVVTVVDLNSTSDERLKTNWRSLPENFLDELCEVKHGIYDRTDVELTQAGVSAQSLQKVLKEAVSEDAQGILSVSYGNAALVAVIELTKLVKEQQKQIEELKNLLNK